MTTHTELPPLQLRRVHAFMDRRLLVNFRMPLDAALEKLPDGFEPQPVKGYAMIGICLIRLTHLRPFGTPPLVQLASENAAHRIACLYPDENGNRKPGVYILERHTDSIANHLAGGRLFPGHHHKATFTTYESPTIWKVGFWGTDGTKVQVIVRQATQVADGSVFEDMDAATCFFQQGTDGWSMRKQGEELEGARIKCHNWNFKPLQIELARSSMLDAIQNETGCVLELDSAFLMEGVNHDCYNLGRKPLKQTPTDLQPAMA